MSGNDTKPSRLATQDPQEANAAANKPSDSQPGASSDQNLLHHDGATQQGTTGAVNTPSANTAIADPVNPNETKPSTTNYTTENMAYALGNPDAGAQEALNETRSEPPPSRK